MVFSLNCSLTRFYRGIIQSSSDLLYPHFYCRPRSSRWLSCTSPRITGSSSISRWRVTRAPISSPVSPPLVSSLCSQRVLAVFSGGLQGPITCCRNIARLQSFIVHSSSNHVLYAIPVSSLYRRCITNVSSKSCQNTARTSPLYCYRFITASSRPLSTLSDPCPSHLHAQLKGCQDIVNQSLVYRPFLVA